MFVQLVLYIFVFFLSRKEKMQKPQKNSKNGYQIAAMIPKKEKTRAGSQSPDPTFDRTRCPDPTAPDQNETEKCV